MNSQCLHWKDSEVDGSLTVTRHLWPLERVAVWVSELQLGECLGSNSLSRSVCVCVSLGSAGWWSKPCLNNNLHCLRNILLWVTMNTVIVCSVEKNRSASVSTNESYLRVLEDISSVWRKANNIQLEWPFNPKQTHTRKFSAKSNFRNMQSVYCWKNHLQKFDMKFPFNNVMDHPAHKLVKKTNKFTHSIAVCL